MEVCTKFSLFSNNWWQLSRKLKSRKWHWHLVPLPLPDLTSWHLAPSCHLVRFVKWIDSFLCFRQQRVVVNGVKSDWAPVLSGVPQGTVLGPLLFSLYINDISSDIESEIRLFADDCVCYREIKDEEDTMKLQRDIDRLGSWARKWGMRFQPVKCNMMQLTRKRIKKIHASYTLEGTDLENVESIKYLGVTITSDLRWNTHVSNVCTKANRTLGFLRRNLIFLPPGGKRGSL